MRRLKITFILSFIIFSIKSYGQLNLKFVPEKMDTTINSKYPEYAPVFSPDRSRMYFVRCNHPDNVYGEEDSQDIWYSDFVNGKWTSAVHMSDKVNLGRYNTLYAVMPSGDLIINGRYTRRGVYLGRGLSRIVVTGNEYSATDNLNIKAYSKKSKGNIESVSFNSSGDKMFLSFSKRAESEKNDLYVSELKNNTWRSPKKLKGPNSNKSDESPFVSADGKTLYFSSNRDGGKEMFDIYSSKIEDSTNYKKWEEPIKIEGKISSSVYDGFFVLDEKEEYAYFSSNRSGKDADIYKVKVKDVKKYVTVKGFVLNADKGDKLKDGTSFKIRVSKNDEDQERVSVKLKNKVVVKDSVYFEFDIPYGQDYTMVATVRNFVEMPVKLNLKNVSRFREFFMDALVTEEPTLIVNGKVDFINFDYRSTNYNDISIIVNDEKIDSIKVDSKGKYQVELPLGEFYEIKAIKDGYTSLTTEVDVEAEKHTITKDVSVKLEKIPDSHSFLNAKVLSRKDSSKLSREIYKVYVNGERASKSMIVKHDGSFELKVEVGKKYFVMVKSHDYIESHDSLDFRKTTYKEFIKKDFLLIPIEVGATVQVKNIYFNLGEASLRSESYVELGRLLDILNDHKDLVIEISGHTDNKGNAYLNKKLSSQRAEAVMMYLIEQGIPEERLTSRGYGFEKPVAPNSTEENRAKNRRVEFTILSNIEH